MKGRKLLSWILATSLLFICTGCSILNLDISFSPSTDNENPVNVIMINDNHGVFHDGEGSIDKIASGIKHYDMLGDIVKIANGDIFQGTYVSSSLKGLPMLDALNALNFDAFVIGNHEFDWGFDEIKKYKDGDVSNGEANFPFLGANIYEKSTGKMVDWLEPYTVVSFDEVKIGIIGIIGEIETSILSTEIEAYDFVDAREIVKDLASELRTEKDCDVVIVAAHADDANLNETLAAYNGNSKIDGIFTGHSHISTDEKIIRADGSKVCVLQNGGNGESFASLTLKFDKNGNLQDTEGKLNYTNTFDSSGILDSVFEKYKTQIAAGERVLGITNEEISRYDLGVTITRAMFVKYNTHFAVINKGGVRTSISAGEVTYADIFQVLPFENTVYIITLSGKDLKSYLKNASGFYYWGIDRNLIEDDQEYQLATVDYVYFGYTFDDYRNDTCINTNDLIRDVLLEWIVGA